MKRVITLFVIVALTVNEFQLPAQRLKQTVKGTVVDGESKVTLPGSNIVILNTEPLIGGMSDLEGRFRLENVPLGRYNIQISFIGYEPVIIPEVIVGSGKEVVLNVELKESVNKMEEVIIKADIKKDAPLNSMASISARTFSVEETRRYAGGLDDPARLASSFAGVSTGLLEDNGIVIRGNAPKGILWRLEGVEIPNPSHYAGLSTFGGGGVTAFSSQMLTNSDFFTSAFPAEFGNALSGVFDMKLRTGNSDKYEHAFQVGVMGIDFASEGPFINDKRASYLFNYRYSTFALIKPVLPEDANVPTYQDLCLKLNFPTKKLGVFSIWGIGALDGLKDSFEEDTTKWETDDDPERSEGALQMGALGVTHKYIIGSKTYINTSLTASGNHSEWDEEISDFNYNFYPISSIDYNAYRYSLSSYFNHKFNAQLTTRTGFIINDMYYNMNIKGSPYAPLPMKDIAEANGRTQLLQVFTQSKYRLTESVTFNVGLHGQYLTLNDNFTLEPRAGINWQFAPRQTLSAGYGNHSQMEFMSYYFAQQATPSGLVQANRNLDFARAHHFVLGYDYSINPNVRLKIEPYYQYLYNVPVIPDTSYSVINLEADWFFNDSLINNGTGTNYGIDITLERFLKDGYYYLLTASVFQSKYKADDGVERDSRFNRNVVINMLGGKEWRVGKGKNNLFGISGRINLMGGDRYTPPDYPASLAAERFIEDGTMLFKKQNPFVYRFDCTIMYTLNKPRHSSKWALQIKNVWGSKEQYGFDYNYRKKSIIKEELTVIVPVLSYKVEF